MYVGKKHTFPKKPKKKSIMACSSQPGVGKREQKSKYMELTNCLFAIYSHSYSFLVLLSLLVKLARSLGLNLLSVFVPIINLFSSALFLFVCLLCCQ